MQKTYQVMKLNIEGATYSCTFYNDGRINPLWLYKHSREFNKHGYLTERKRLVEKYADINSVLYYLARNIR